MEMRRIHRLSYQRKKTGQSLPFGQPCACCSLPMTRPHLDHCHRTGRVRGWICLGDNVSLGQANDDPARCLYRVQDAVRKADSGKRPLANLELAKRWINRSLYLLRHQEAAASTESADSESLGSP